MQLCRGAFSIFCDINQYYLTDFKKKKNHQILKLVDILDIVPMLSLCSFKEWLVNTKNSDSYVSFHALSFAMIIKGLKNVCMTLHNENTRFSHGLSLN